MPAAKYNDDFIRQHLGQGESANYISTTYGISKERVRKIRDGRSVGQSVGQPLPVDRQVVIEAESEHLRQESDHDEFDRGYMEGVMDAQQKILQKLQPLIHYNDLHLRIPPKLLVDAVQQVKDILEGGI